MVSKDSLPQAAADTLEPNSLPSTSTPIPLTQIMLHQMRREFSGRDIASIVAHKGSPVDDETKYSLYYAIEILPYSIIFLISFIGIAKDREVQQSDHSIGNCSMNFSS